MRIFDYIKRVLKCARKDCRPSTSFQTQGTITTTSGFYLASPKPQPSVTFSSVGTWTPQPDAVHQLVGKVVAKIDEKTLSDYEFREWLRDNLSGCEYQSENGSKKYAKADDIRPISVIDAMLEVDK
jgi:hypothetical protein